MGCTRNTCFPITISIQVLCDDVFVVIFFKTVYNKTIIRFGFCDIPNNQSLGKCYQPRPSARLITLTSTLIIPDITKSSSNDCQMFSKSFIFSGLTSFQKPQYCHPFCSASKFDQSCHLFVVLAVL